jgi:predicted transcriptional regulator
MVYHMVMSRKQVLVQLDDDLVERLDRLATRLGVSRSQLLRRGALAVLEADGIKRADRELIAAYTRTPQDPLVAARAGRRAAENVPEW